MKNKEKTDNQYIYDTPMGIIEKEGRLLRGMSSYDNNRPFWVKILIIFFSLMMFVFPAIFLFVLGIIVINFLLIFFGILFLICGTIAIYKNLKR